MPIKIGAVKISDVEKQKAAEAAKKKAERAAKVLANQNLTEAEKIAKKAKESKRKRDVEALLFGSDLFEPAMRKEKEVVIHFPEACTNEGLHISKCGKFAYQRTKSDFYFNVYYFTVPILEFENDLIIIPDDVHWLFADLTCAELEDLCIRLKRAEYAEEKAIALAEVKRIEAEKKAELDKIDEEFEKENELKEAEIVENDYATIDTLLTYKIMNDPEIKEMIEAADRTSEIIDVAAAEVKQEIKIIKKPTVIPPLFRKVVR